MRAPSNLTFAGRVVVGVAMAATLVGAGAARPATASTAPPSTPPAVDLDAALAELIGEQPGGAVVLVVRDDVTTAAAAGVANAAGDPMTIDTAFRIGSLTKPFVATLVLQLVDDGLVDLDATLSTYLPDTPVGGDVTIRDLLRHRSGVPNYTETDGFIDSMTADRNRVFTPGEIVEMIIDEPAAAPDVEFAYSNTNYVLLGQLLEHVGGADVATLLRDRITEPLGLEVTQFAAPGSAVPGGLAGGWSPDIALDGDPAAPYNSIASAAWTAGAIISTAGELQLFLEGLFGGELLSAEALADMTTTDPDDYGLGIGLLTLPSGTGLFGHDGDIFGYLSLMAIEPVSGDMIVVLTNNNEIAPFDLAEQVIGNW